MKEEVCKKTLRELGVFYLIIIALTNFLGFLLVNSGIMPTQMSIEHAAWLKFLSSKNIIVNVLSVFGFILPALFCLLYVVKVSDGALEKKIINLPLVYSIFGSFGWIISFIFETSYLICFKIIYKYAIYKIMINSFFNIIQASLFIFTFSFFCIDAIHRKFVLPKLFPGGNITKRSGRIKLSSKFLFIIFYLSVGIFPVFYFFSTLYNFSINSNVTIASGIYYITLVIIIFGIINVINISNYFSIPIKKIKNATNEIVKSDYSKHVEIVSCDDLGELADNFNDMADALAEKTRKILAIQDSVIKGMAVMVESRDNSTGGHINRTVSDGRF